MSGQEVDTEIMSIGEVAHIQVWFSNRPHADGKWIVEIGDMRGAISISNTDKKEVMRVIEKELFGDPNE